MLTYQQGRKRVFRSGGLLGHCSGDGAAKQADMNNDLMILTMILSKSTVGAYHAEWFCKDSHRYLGARSHPMLFLLKSNPVL